MDAPNFEALTLKELADRADVLRERKREAAAQEKAASRELEAVLAVLMTKMDEQGMDRFSANEITFSVSEAVVPSVKDWEAVHAYIKEHDYMHLLERRMSAVAFRELLAAEGEIPGVEPFTKRSIGMRKS